MSQRKDESLEDYHKRLQNVSKPVELDDLPEAVKEYHRKIEKGEIVSEETQIQREKEKSGLSNEQNWLYYCPSCNKPSMERMLSDEGKQQFHCTYCGLDTVNPRKVANFPQHNKMM